MEHPKESEEGMTLDEYRKKYFPKTTWNGTCPKCKQRVGNIQQKIPYGNCEHCYAELAIQPSEYMITIESERKQF